MKTDAEKHYDMMVEEGTDFALDPPVLLEYLNKWDGDIFIEKMQLTGTESVLEIGVGTGRIALKVCGKCKSFSGVDFSSKSIEKAKINLAKFDNTELVCSDFFDYNTDNKFDVIYSTLTFMHIKEKQKAIDKVFKMLHAGGRFLLSIDNNPSKVIDYGTRVIKVYPDNADDTKQYILSSGLELIETINTELGTIFVVVKK